MKNSNINKRNESSSLFIIIYFLISRGLYLDMVRGVGGGGGGRVRDV